MPSIDVMTEVLLDGVVAATSFVVVRRRSVTDTDGFENHLRQRVSAIGSVYPTGDNSLVRSADEQLQSKTLTVVTQFPLRGASSLDGAEWQPDLVYWRGDYFLVQNVEDFTQFGSGMVVAECTSFDYTEGSAPLGPDPALGYCVFDNQINSDLIKVVSP